MKSQSENSESQLKDTTSTSTMKESKIPPIQSEDNASMSTLKDSGIQPYDYHTSERLKYLSREEIEEELEYEKELDREIEEDKKGIEDSEKKYSGKYAYLKREVEGRPRNTLVQVCYVRDKDIFFVDCPDLYSDPYFHCNGMLVHHDSLVFLDDEKKHNIHNSVSKGKSA